MSTNLKLVGVAALAGVAGFLIGRKSLCKGHCKKTCTKKAVKSVPADFNDAFSVFLSDFVGHLQKEFALNDAMAARVKKLCEYTCMGGKCFRGILVATSVSTLCEAKGLKFEDYRTKSHVLGWCIEILQAMFLVADDIMDFSITRRGQPCWYKLPEIQLDAVNDSLILESFLYFLLDQYFKEDCLRVYVKLNELFREVSLQTEVGQMLDLVSQPQGRQPKLEDFNLTLYTQIVTYKTAFYTFYLPIASALIFMGEDSPTNLALARDISIDIGVKFQIQDDYLDAYGEPQMIGKVGTDIEDHKCSWLCVQSLLRMSPDQKKTFQQHYGKHDAASVAEIKNIYKQLDLTSVYEAQEESSYAAIINKVKALPPSLPHGLFLPILDKIHKRQK